MNNILKTICMKMNLMENPAVYFKDLFSKKPGSNTSVLRTHARGTDADTRPVSPFAVILRKEITDHIRSWRFIVLLALILLTFISAMYVSLSNLKAAIGNVDDPDRLF